MPLVANRDLRKKLLQLFPIKFVKDHFNETGNRDDVIEVISGNNSDTIANFVLTYHNVTKQNIYLYKLDHPFNPGADMVNFPMITGRESHVGNIHTYIFFPETTYSVYLNNPVIMENISFLQPFVIEIEGDNLIVKFTKLEKNIKSYFSEDREPKIANETNTEDDSLRQILAHFNAATGIRSNDFNRGIKQLWGIDDLDCHKIRYRDTHSTILITMDETLTFKQQYPEKYEEMIHSPIGPSLWKYLFEDINVSGTFTCDPTEGTISVNKYSDNTNQISNVITRILAEN